MIQAFIYGAILAFGLIIPVGMQNVFIFNQGATQKRFSHAMPSVLTASICDALLITLAVLGVSVIILTIPWIKIAIFSTGFCFLIYMGWTTWNSKPKTLTGTEKPLSAKKQIVFTMSVSLLNPHTLLDTVSVIGTYSLNFIGRARWVYTIACILVSFIWFFTLSVAGHFLRKLDKNGSWQVIINRLSALIIWAVSIYIGFQLFRHWN